MDLLVYGAIVVSFAAFVTVHAALSFGLAMRPPRYRGPVGLIVLPLAPYWGFRAGLRARSVLWILSGAAYLGALAVGTWG